MSADPQAIDLAAPRSRFERASVQHADGTVIDLPLFTSHLLCDENGAYPAELNSWEKAVVEKEMARPGFVAWYRNPAQASQDSLGISYAGGKSEARRVGKECGRTCRSRLSPYH